MLAVTLMVPASEAGMSAALDVMLPSRAFSVDTVGCAPGPHRVRKPSAAGGTTVAFSEKPAAVGGMAQMGWKAIVKNRP